MDTNNKQKKKKWFLNEMNIKLMLKERWFFDLVLLYEKDSVDFSSIRVIIPKWKPFNKIKKKYNF